MENEAADILDLIGRYELHTVNCSTARDIPFPCDCGGEALTERLMAFLRTKAEAPIIDSLVTYDERDGADGTHVVERTYWCRICGELPQPCVHIDAATKP